MIEVGKINTLKVNEKVAFGFNLDGENLGDILLLNKQIKGDLSVGDDVDVFVYMDSDDKLLATMNRPKALVGEFAFLPVIAVSRVGCFLDLGISKDVLVRENEQRIPMKEGQSYVVKIYHEADGLRITASSKLDYHFNPEIGHYDINDKVTIMVWEETELGYKVIINNADLGLLYKSEVFQPLSVGQKTQAYIKKIRDDMKIDVILQKPGYAKPDSLTQKILKCLEDADGFLAVNDKSDAAEIYRLFGVSKKKFKMAIGGLYKNKIIEIGKDGIRLLNSTSR